MKEALNSFSFFPILCHFIYSSFVTYIYTPSHAEGIGPENKLLRSQHYKTNKRKRLCKISQ